MKTEGCTGLFSIQSTKRHPEFLKVLLIQEKKTVFIEQAKMSCDIGYKYGIPIEKEKKKKKKKKKK